METYINENQVDRVYDLVRDYVEKCMEEYINYYTGNSDELDEKFFEDFELEYFIYAIEREYEKWTNFYDYMVENIDFPNEDAFLMMLDRILKYDEFLGLDLKYENIIKLIKNKNLIINRYAYVVYLEDIEHNIDEEEMLDLIKEKYGNEEEEEEEEIIIIKKKK